MSEDLSESELKEYERRIQEIDAMIDQAQVNYSYDSKDFVYSDKNGFDWYHSDTNNQISATVYSEKFFINNFCPWMIGIGFNKLSLNEEAIVLSSDIYVTTNKGLNNLEYNQKKEFDIMGSTYKELISNDGKSEVVLFRRGLNYDTKANYIFLTIDSTQIEKSKEYINYAETIARKNNLNLVIYDLFKIRKSYNHYLTTITKETEIECKKAR